MKLKNNLSVFILLLIFNFSYSQMRKTADFGKPTQKELDLKTYDKDPEASGVVLFENGFNKIELIDGYIKLIKKVHRKIKVINAKNFEEFATVEIPYRKDKNTKEKITDFKAITHNNQLVTYVTGDKVYDIDINEDWSMKRFTFSNVKDGSVLEYKYTLISSFFFNFDGWNFKGELPKMYSEFGMELPGNFIYNKSLVGSHPLYINEAKIREHCFSIPGTFLDASCEIGLYAMIDLPAYKDENYMLSKENYNERLDFELMKYTNYKGEKKIFTKKWEYVDREFKNDNEIGRQLNHNVFFKNQLSEAILSNPNELEKAKAIYYFIQKHYNWNGSYRMYENINVKRAFEKKSGTISEINLSLINALQAADLDAKFVMHSTRKNGLPTKAYPVLTDFNYLLAYLKIGNKTYLLDATDGYSPFNILPFRALNKEVRVMDRKGSYWMPIEPHVKNVNFINAQISFNEDESIIGNVNEIHTGYHAISIRKTNNNLSHDERVLAKEKNEIDIEITEYSVENENNLEEPYKEKYNVLFDPEIAGTTLYINPFIFKKSLLINPFKEEKRQFPIEFGYPSSNTYLLKINLGNLYKVDQLPKSKTIKLPENAGSCTVAYSEANGSINVRLNYKLNDYSFSTDYYETLKEFFDKVVEFQTKDIIVLKKI